ncbi:MAG: CGGC domain-containing protein [Deltaproteobacteria bacterium]|jgi:predicted metal-binding protein|nr:CGGC domain-containing protein [Deltaproteobacteria bacterium]
MAEKRTATWSNTISYTGSPSFSHLKDLNECNVEFMRHKEKGSPEIVGIINCFGCQPEEALEKCFGSMSSIMAAGVDTILLSACMIPFCRFRKELMETMKEKPAETETGKGTHGNPLRVPGELFMDTMRRIFTQLAIHRTYSAR